VDVGAVNGRVFLNNSSIGLYPSVVIRRDNRRKRTGTGKWTALAWASFSVLRRHPMMDVTLHVNGRTTRHRTPLLFIGNNEYVVRGPDAGTRTDMRDGKLAIYITRRHGRLGLIALFLRALFGSLRKALDLEAFTATRVTIDTGRSRIAVATDGEVSVMDTPLEYENRPGALQGHRGAARRARSRSVRRSCTCPTCTSAASTRRCWSRCEPASTRSSPTSWWSPATSRSAPSRDQFREAKAFLDSLPKPQLVVPGNHDVPLFNVFQRILSPLGKYKRIVTRDLEPEFIDDEIAVIGLNTTRSFVWKDGSINSKQVEHVKGRICNLAERVIKVVVTHHPFDVPKDHNDAEIVDKAERAMKAFAQCGADLLLSGHLHKTHTCRRTSATRPMALGAHRAGGHGDLDARARRDELLQLPAPHLGGHRDRTLAVEFLLEGVRAGPLRALPPRRERLAPPALRRKAQHRDHKGRKEHKETDIRS
jgi:hypothetical protein